MLEPDARRSYRVPPSSTIGPGLRPEGARSSRRWFWLRVGVLSLVLLSVVFHATHSTWRRWSRTTWSRPLLVGISLVTPEPMEPELVDELRARIPALEAKLKEELHRYRPTPDHPFDFVLLGPTVVQEPPPAAPEDGLWDQVRFAYGLYRWTSMVDRRLGLPDGGSDVRVYVVAHKPARGAIRSIEGRSQQGGEIGIVEVDLDRGTTDWALYVTAHELLHTLWATDKYDEWGRTLIPEGLAEPEAVPRYPQRYCEIMTRERMLSENSGKALETLEELSVGRRTAAEIGWIPSP